MSLKKTVLSSGGGGILLWRAFRAVGFLVIHCSEGLITLFYSSQK